MQCPLTDREKEIEGVGGSGFTFKKKGISSCGSGWLVSNVVSGDV